MNRRILLSSVATALILALGIFLGLGRLPPRNALKYASLFWTPISFYGKVIDEKGNPVEGADVKFVAGDQMNPYGKNSQYSGKSGKEGMFSISWIHGASLYVEVSKNGYYRTPSFDGHRGSSDGFPYDGIRGKTDPPIPTPDKSAIFVLRKRGLAASLVQVLKGPVMVPKDGSPVKISLQTGDASPQGELTVECWTQDETKDAQGHYPWLCQVSVPGGGLAKREGEFDFEAPLEGYQTFGEIAPPKDRWSSQAESQYFVKSPDNHYARITVNMITGSSHFVAIGSYYNPTAGDRNLEFDPARQESPH
jgi:hypothetical protein